MRFTLVCCQGLEGQLIDLIELHQNEIENLKQGKCPIDVRPQTALRPLFAFAFDARLAAVEAFKLIAQH